MKKMSMGLIALAAVLFYAFPQIIKASDYTDKDKLRILTMVEGSPVRAVVKRKGNLYEDMDKDSSIVKTIEKGTEVEILKDTTMKWYYVYDEYDGEMGWIARDYIEIPKDPDTNTILMDSRSIEGFINIMGFQSDTDYFVWTDIDRQVTHIFTGKKGNWKLLKSISCSTGRNVSPTTRGLFKIEERGLWFFSKRLQSGAKYWVRFNGTYLFHSVAMDEQKRVVDSTLGKRSSSGCIRMSVEDAKWFYATLSKGTSVFIH